MYMLDDDRLAALNIRRAEPLDIEEDSVDFGPRFFRPRFTLEDARENTNDFLVDHRDSLGYTDWPKRCRRGSFDDPVTLLVPGPYDSEDRHPLCDPKTDAVFRLRWFMCVMGVGFGSPWDDSPNLGVWEDSEWSCVHACWLVRDRLGSLPSHDAHEIQVGNPPRRYSFHANYALLLHNNTADIPHIGGTVVDSVESSEGEVLRSEVAAALGLLKLQFRRGDFREHHTLPAIVFSLQHDRFGRVTQFHFNGRSLVLRQSRLLNFRSDEPTVDAYHMIRWMANRPMGETRFGNGAADQTEEPESRDTDKNTGSLPVRVRGS